jgi:HSP20 family protein
MAPVDAHRGERMVAARNLRALTMVGPRPTLEEEEVEVMANIIRRTEQPRAVARPTTEYPIWEPFRAMRDLMRWDPFQELEPMLGRERLFSPRFDVTETSGTYVFKADLPGVQESDLDISLTGNQLRISGQRSEEHVEEADRSHVSERSYGTFLRSFTLPEGCDPDHAQAEMKHGVLTLTIPKKPEMQPRKINLSGESEKGSKGKA